MTIEEDFAYIRKPGRSEYKEFHAALDRIEGYIEQCADFQRAAEQERDALKAAYEAHELLATEEVRNSGPKTEAALKRLFAARQALAKLEEK